MRLAMQQRRRAATWSIVTPTTKSLALDARMVAMRPAPARAYAPNTCYDAKLSYPTRKIAPTQDGRGVGREALRDKNGKQGL